MIPAWKEKEREVEGRGGIHVGMCVYSSRRTMGEESQSMPVEAGNHEGERGKGGGGGEAAPLLRLNLLQIFLLLAPRQHRDALIARGRREKEGRNLLPLVGESLRLLKLPSSSSSGR